MTTNRFLLIALLLGAIIPVQAQEKLAAATTPAAALTPPPVPAASSTWGGDFRVRYESYANAQTLSSLAPFNDRDYFRVRLRVWETTNPAPGLSFYGRISAEPRYWYSAVRPNPGHGEEWKYAIVDNLNATWTNNFNGLPITVILGRQDIQLGDQWLVSDGTPIDGSWTNHFDGLRVTLDAKSIKTKFDVIVLNQQARPGDRLPVLGNHRDHAGADYCLTEQDETGVIVYASNKSIKNVQIDGYFISKDDTKVASTGDNAAIYTLGAKVSGTPTAHWLYSAEGAYQFGNRDLTVRYPVTVTGSRDISAYGFNAKLAYLFKDSLSNQVALIAEYLSGDKAGTTGKDEMFDVLWGRYPRIGETWAVAYSTETGGRNAQYNNLGRLGATWTISPMKSTSIAATYCAMFAPESKPTRTTNAARFSGDGHFRGNMYQVVVKQKITSTLSGLLFAEVSPLGDFYARRNTISFVRAEVMLTF